MATKSLCTGFSGSSVYAQGLTIRSSRTDGSFGLADTLNQLSGVLVMAKAGPRTPYRYSREFKATAGRLSQKASGLLRITNGRKWLP